MTLQGTGPRAEAGDAPALEPGDSPHHPLAPWFAAHRRHRRARYASALHRTSRRRTRALITMVHNEPVFLPIWLRYYSRFFAPEDIFVLDNDSTDASTTAGGFIRIPAGKARVDHVWMRDTIQELQNDLLRRYDLVLVTDVDEIVAPNPGWGTLGQYLDRFDEDWVNCLGYEVLHRRAQEPPLDLARPILAQRHWWYFNDAYNKAALASVPMSWTPGFHGRSDGGYNLDPDLRLIHLHRMDYDVCRERHGTRRRRRWARQDARRGWAAHNRLVAGEEFERWFEQGAYFEGVEVRPERIPEVWRSLV